ncbi:hypothetical protein MRB53_037809 [Persea americana]|nr:hypothetical protein MRB53_037809 [Persea americana]
MEVELLPFGGVMLASVLERTRIRLETVAAQADGQAYARKGSVSAHRLESADNRSSTIQYCSRRERPISLSQITCCHFTISMPSKP